MIIALYTMHYYFIQPANLTDNTLNVTIQRVEQNRNRAIGQYGAIKVLIVCDTLSDISAGDQVIVEGTFKDPTPPSMPGEFDYDRYLASLGIAGVFYADSLQKTAASFSIHSLAEWIEKRILNQTNVSSAYLLTFILADRHRLDEDVLTRASALGITHLFAVSGLHISMLSFAFYKGLTLFKIRERSKITLLSGILALYMLVTAFAVSVVRSTLLTVSLMLNKRLKLGFTPVDLCAWVCIGLLLYNPLYFVQSGFVLSFLVTFTLLLSQPLLNRLSKPKQMFSVSAIAFLSALPITAQFNGTFSLITPISNMFFVAYTMFLLLPMGYLTFLIPPFESVYKYVIRVFEQSVTWFHDDLHVGIRFLFPHVLIIVIYICLLYFLFGAKTFKQAIRRGLLFASLFLIIFIWPYLNIYQRVVFFHVHGDSILLQDRFNRCNILIDTGDHDPTERLITALRTLHVRRLDYVIITHRHKDHYGMYEVVKANFPITTTITNESQYQYENTMITCGSFLFSIFPFDDMVHRENDRSLVMKIWVQNDVYLFTGDIESAREKNLLSQNTEATILKVAHHGSRTSTSSDFLDAVNPEVAIISAHRNNRFNHPSESVIERLHYRDITILRTDLHGTIFIRYLRERTIKKTFSPP